MSDYIAQLAALTDEEQAIYALDWRDAADFARLAAIACERSHLLDLERARKAGAPINAVPTDGWKIDRSGYTVARPRRDRAMHHTPHERRTAPRDLPKGVEWLASGRVRAVCYTRAGKLSLGTFDPTPDAIALAGRMAAAARSARDRGMDAGRMVVAALAVAEEEVSHAAAAD